jgi:hypothetical protein
MGDTPNQPSVGDALRGTQTGRLPIGTVEEILKKAPADLVEEVLEIPEWGCSVKVRSFTGAVSAMIRQAGFVNQGQTTVIDWAQMERKQLQLGIVEPKFSEEDIAKLYLQSGRGVRRIIDWLDENSSIDKEELKRAREEFQGSQESS